MILNYKLFNPLFFYLLMFLQNKTIRNIIMFGGSSSGKTYSMAQAILILPQGKGRSVNQRYRLSRFQDSRRATWNKKVVQILRWSQDYNLYSEQSENRVQWSL